MVLRLRWVVVGLVAVATVINYIDRNALAVMWPGISEEMGLDKNDYALVLTFFMVGYAIGHPRVTNYINRVRRAFNVTSAGQAAALAALDDDAHVNRSRTENASGVAKLKAAAEGLGLRAYPSLGNFVLVDVGRDHEDLVEQTR